MAKNHSISLETKTLDEIWKDIKDYVGIYQVSNWGNVRSLDRWIKNRDSDLFRKGRPMKSHSIKGGYKLIMLQNMGKKSFLVHKLVLEAFVGPCPDGMECRHFPDRNPANNRLENLSWGTHLENMGDQDIHGSRCVGSARYCAKLTESDIPVIRQKLADGEGVFGTVARIAREYNVHYTIIHGIKTGKGWKHVP